MENNGIMAQERREVSVYEYEARIQLYREQIGTGYIGIGRTLNEAKESGKIGHGEWEGWVERVTGLTIRQAQRCMQAAREIREGSEMARLEMSKALALLSSGLEEEDREALARKSAEEGGSLKALKEEIRQMKLKAVQEAGAAAEIREALKKAEAEKESIAQQMRDTVSAYQKRMDELSGDAYRRGLSDRAEGLRAEIRKEFQAKIDHINRERDGLEESRQELIRQLDEAQREGSRQWDDGFQRGKEQNAKDLEKLQQSEAALMRRIDDMEDETQRLLRQCDEDAREEEREKLEKELRERDDLKRNQEDLLAAAEEAEKRAAEAEAELEALKAGGSGKPDPAWKIIQEAVRRFMDECEMLPLTDPQGIVAGGVQTEMALKRVEDWAAAMRETLAGVMTGEGAVI